jgi:hypothetical protein
MAAATVVLAVMAVPGLAQAATRAPASARTEAPNVAYKLGSYTGAVHQTAPQAYTGKIGFTVHRQTITALSFTVGVVCQALQVTDQDLLTHFSTKVLHTGAFSYSGTMKGRHIRLQGKLKDGRATGTFFQSFVSGSLHCSMSQPAAFTAKR